MTSASKATAAKKVVKKAETPKIDETSGDESEDDGLNTGSVKRKAPAPPADPIVTNLPGSGLAFAGIARKSFGDSSIAQAAKEPTPKTEDDNEITEEHHPAIPSLFNNPSSPAVAGTETAETEMQAVLSSIENDDDAMSKYINLPEEMLPEDVDNNIEHADHGSDEKSITEADALFLKSSAEHVKYPGNANRELTGMHKHSGSAHKEARVDTPLHHRSPGPEPRAESLLHHQPHLQRPTRTPSVSAHVHLPTTISLSLTLVSATDNATSHLMVVPTSANFAELLGRYVMQLPQGDVGHEALADAAHCAVKGADGKIHRFGFREAGVERLWRAAIGRSVRSRKTGVEEEDVIEVELH